MAPSERAVQHMGKLVEQHDILGLDIAMDNVQAVQVGERTAQLREDVPRIGLR